MTDLERIRARLPAHYNDCRSVYWNGVPADCDCTATADIKALLDLVADVDQTLAELAPPYEDDGT